MKLRANTLKKRRLLVILAVFIALIVTALLAARIVMSINREEAARRALKNSVSRTAKLSFAAWGNPAEREIQRTVAKEFSEKNKVEVDAFCFSDIESCMSKVITQFAAGDPFDVFYCDTRTFHTLSGKEWLIDLTVLEIEKKVKAEEYYEPAYGKCKFNGKLLGLPTGINPYVLYYNEKLFTQAGLSSPEEYYKNGRWDEVTFLKACSSIKEKGKAYGISLRNDWPTVFSLLRMNNGKTMGFLSDGTIQGSDQAIQSVKAVRQAIQNENVVYMGSLPKGVTEEELFKSEQVAMVYGGYEYAFAFKDIKDFKWDIVPFPTSQADNRNAVLDIPVISAAKTTKHKETAQRFLMFYAGTTGQKFRLEKGEKILPSLRYTVYLSGEDIKLPAHSNYYFFSLSEGATEESSMNYLESRNRLFQKFHEVFLGYQPIESIFQ